MNDDLSDIRGRQDRLEGRMTQLEAKVELEAGLRAAMDRELGTISAKLNAHQQSLNALQAVQSDHTKRLTRIEDRLTGVQDRLTGVQDRLTGVRDRLGNVETDLVTVKTGVHAILGLLDTNLAKKSLADRLAGRLLRQCHLAKAGPEALEPRATADTCCSRHVHGTFVHRGTFWCYKSRGRRGVTGGSAGRRRRCGRGRRRTSRGLLPAGRDRWAAGLEHRLLAARCPRRVPPASTTWSPRRCSRRWPPCATPHRTIGGPGARK